MIDEIKVVLDRPIVLVGMMGSGKSRLGRALANELDLEFFDSDTIIEQKAGRSVPEIFEEFGEEKFRSAEENTILELLERGPCVIATGGGAVTSPISLEAIKNKAFSIWLHAEIDVIMARIEGDDRRPLLQGDDPRIKLQTLLAQREALYAQADLQVEIGRQSIHETLQILIKTLYSRVIPGSFS